MIFEHFYRIFWHLRRRWGTWLRGFRIEPEHFWWVSYDLVIVLSISEEKHLGAKSFKKSWFLMFFNDFWLFFDDFWSILKHFRVVFWDFLLFLGWQPTKCSISELRWSCGTVCCINYAQMNHTSRLETPLSRQKKVRPLY